MRSYLLLSLATSLTEAICHHGTNAFYRRAEEATFGYTNLQGPLAWHSLATENELCAKGKTQSPISVTADNSSPVEGSTLNFDITNFPDGAELENLGTTLEVAANGTISLNDKTYSLAQFHFHTPSEHRIDDEYYPMEVHFVFQDDADNLAVVGVMVEVAAMEVPSPFIASVFANLEKATERGAAAETAPIDFTALKEHIASTNVWQYQGSLTTPSCDEGVAWNVVERPVFVSSTVYRKVKSVIKFNSRFTQNAPGEANLLENACTAL
ncbi:eukaryotic-type carbonic anhydrase domain-containing protein [Sarocladium implicatum]|nr:eukaryotic-type carbonic anhydrase domain-containing protein [Sarocladium implicatum]